MKTRKRKMTDAELREYYDRTSSLEEGRPGRRVHMTFPKPRCLIAMRLEEETIEAVKRLAAERGLNYSTLLRMWITERLRRETKA